MVTGIGKRIRILLTYTCTCKAMATLRMMPIPENIKRSTCGITYFQNFPTDERYLKLIQSSVGNFVCVCVCV